MNWNIVPAATPGLDCPMRSRLFVLICALSLPALADTYKWTDSAGQVHYSQTRPPTGSYEVLGHAPPPSDAPNQDALNQSLQKSAAEAPKQKEEADRLARLQAERLDRCKAAMNQLTYLDTTPPRRMASTDDKGNPVRMNDEDVAKKRAEVQKQIKENCD